MYTVITGANIYLHDKTNCVVLASQSIFPRLVVDPVWSAGALTLLTLLR
jgi:hypothetical protein